MSYTSLSKRLTSALVESCHLRQTAFDPKRSLKKGSNRPILLKKSASVSKAEKCAFEIEIGVLSKGFGT
jgi:hypothetical protein